MHQMNCLMPYDLIVLLPSEAEEKSFIVVCTL